MSNEKKESKPVNAAQVKRNEKLAQQIEQINAKHSLVRKRAKFQTVFDRLVELDYAEQKEFFATEYSSNVKWQLVNGREIIFSLSAPEVLVQVQEFFLKKISKEMAN
jgi:hypothetical protein